MNYKIVLSSGKMSKEFEINMFIKFSNILLLMINLFRYESFNNISEKNIDDALKNNYLRMKIVAKGIDSKHKNKVIKYEKMISSLLASKLNGNLITEFKELFIFLQSNMSAFIWIAKDNEETISVEDLIITSNILNSYSTIYQYASINNSEVNVKLIEIA